MRISRVLLVALLIASFVAHVKGVSPFGLSRGA
jgi:hypothetical protein